MGLRSALAALFKRDDRRTPAITEPVGSPGTAVVGGQIDSQEKAAELRGSRRFKKFDDIKHNTEIVATGIRRVQTLVKGATWRLQPPELEAASEQAEAERIADAITSILLAPRAMKRPWPKVVAWQFGHVWDGCAMSAWQAKNRDDGLVGFEDIAPRPMKTVEHWDITQADGFKGVWQRSVADYREVYFPRGRMVYTVDNDIDDSPAGTGRLRHVVKLCEDLERFEQIEGWGAETDLAGVPFARVPYSKLKAQVADPKTSFSQADMDEVLSGIRKFIKERVITPGRGLMVDSAMYLDKEGNPSGHHMFTVDLLQSNLSGSLAAANTVIERKIRGIARLMGIEGLLLGSTGAGSYALAKDKTAALAQMITSGLDDVSYSLDADVVVPLMLLNGWDLKYTPTLVASAVDLRDVEAIVAALEGLARAALDPDDEAADEVRELVGVSPRPVRAFEEDARIKPPPPPAKDDPDAVEDDLNDTAEAA